MGIAPLLELLTGAVFISFLPFFKPYIGWFIDWLQDCKRGMCLVLLSVVRVSTIQQLPHVAFRSGNRIVLIHPIFTRILRRKGFTIIRKLRAVMIQMIQQSQVDIKPAILSLRNGVVQQVQPDCFCEITFCIRKIGGMQVDANHFST